MTTPHDDAPASAEQLEVERKYDLPADAVVPDLGGVGAVAAVRRHDVTTLRAEYHDTADRALLGARVTLRRRTGGHDAGWHLKLPGDRGRRELHAPLGGEGEPVPESLLAPVTDVLRGEAVAPVVLLVTERSAVDLLDASGRALAELADDHVVASAPEGGRSVSWREWEVELATGVAADEGESVLDAVEGALTAAGARPSASRSKLARALRALDAQGRGGDAAPA